MQSKKCLWKKKKKKTLIVSCITSLSIVILRKQISQIKIRLELIAHIALYLCSSITTCLLLYFFQAAGWISLIFWSLVWIRRRNVGALIKSPRLRNDAVQCASFIFIIFKLKSICQKRWRQPSKDNKICHPTKVTFLMAD